MAEVSLDVLPADLIARADSLRDSREWEAAVEAYGDVLAVAPLAWPFMAHRGHGLKEAGELEAAPAMYRQAEALVPDDFDVAMQIGDALRLLGRRAESGAAYARAFRLDPKSAEAWREAEALDALPPGPGPVAPIPQLVLDITDLLDHFNHRLTPTGIQRVQIRMSSELMAAPPAGTELVLAAFSPGRLGWVRVPEDACRRLLDLSAAGAEESDADWRDALAAMGRIRATAPPIGFKDGAVLSPLGGLWAYADWFRALAEARRRTLIRLIPFIHDCVPLLLPETCEEGTVANYASWFAGFARMGDGFVCNSEATRTDVLTELARLSPGLALPGRAVRLDGDPRPLVPEGTARAIPGLIPGEPYVLMVGTIEPRKDHATLFRAWRALIRRHGATAPRLVCAGRIGWRAEAALEILDASPELRRHVLLLDRASDADLAALYRGALFTIYTSLHEGWGLPVTESLAYGRVPLVPRVAALPESGGDRAAYYAPGSEADLLAAIERLLSDPAARRMDPVPLRSWAGVAQELAGAIATVAATGAASERGLPSSGPVWQFGRSAASRPDIARADAALLLDLPAVPAGALSIVLESAAGVGLSSLLLCRLDDVAARLSFLEGQRFRASPFVQ